MQLQPRSGLSLLKKIHIVVTVLLQKGIFFLLIQISTQFSQLRHAEASYKLQIDTSVHIKYP